MAKTISQELMPISLPSEVAEFRNAIDACGIHTVIDPPTDHENGVWWIELYFTKEGDYFEEIEWTSERGFGFYEQVMACGFGERPTDLIGTVKPAIELAMARIADARLIQ